MRRNESRSRGDNRRITRDEALGSRRLFVALRLSPCPSLVGTEKMASSRVPEIQEANKVTCTVRLAPGTDAPVGLMRGHCLPDPRLVEGSAVAGERGQ